MMSMQRSISRAVESVRPLPGPVSLLYHLTDGGVPWAIATSGQLKTSSPTLELLDIPKSTPVVTREDVRHAKPDPDWLSKLPVNWALAWTMPQSWATAFWDLLRRPALILGLWAAFASSPAVMDEMNSNPPEHTEYMTILPT